MDTKDLKAAKKHTEKMIYESVSGHMKNLETKTGIGVSDIELHFHTVEEFGNEMKNIYLLAVSVTLNI